MNIYFIQQEPDGPVKIGKATDVMKRLTMLQIGCPEKLKVLYSFEVPDEKSDYAEKHIHYCFRNRRIRGEWFMPCPYLYDYIKAIKEKGFFVNWDQSIDEEEEAAYTIDNMSNKVNKLIEETYTYGDIRRIQHLESELEELHRYAKRFLFD